MSPTKRPIAEDWYHQSFDTLYPVVYAHRTVETARPEAHFSIQQTELRSTDRVLDLCCGSGRHMRHLLDVTPHVVGLDYSPHLLEMAQDLLGPGAMLVRADMCCQPFTAVFDVVMNYFTSFGYFQTREENLNVVRGISHILKPGGRFFIDYMNRPWTESNLQERTVRFVDGFEIREHRWIDSEHHRSNKATIVCRNGQELKDAGESVQLYTEDEFVRLLVDGGLRVEHLYGGYDAAPLADDQPRMIAVGRKA